MAKTLNSPQHIDQEETKKQRKKQAKRESKLILELEKAKKNVQRAEQKVSKAQSHLEASRSHVHELEEGLAQIRGQQTPLVEPAVATTSPESGEATKELLPEHTSRADQEES